MLLEFDERFGVFKEDFSFYDYKQPFKLDRTTSQIVERRTKLITVQPA